VAQRQTSPEEMPIHPTKRMLRSYLRFSLRTLIVVVLLAGGMLGWIVHRAHVQRDAVAAIKRAGGTVHYDWESHSDGSFRSSAKPWAPKWLVDLVGIDYFGHVARIDLPTKGSDGDLIKIGRLSGLWNLNLDFSPVTDAGLANLKGLTDLERLYLPLTKVGDAGLVQLQGLKGLRQLGFYDNAITDEGLANLAGLTNLEYLILDGTRVTDSGLAHLKGLKNLTRLSLNRTPVGDAGLVNLQHLTHLTELYVSQTRITDGGLKHLQGMKSLKELILEGTQVSDAGVLELQRALPHLIIRH
jgi:internalin A